MSEFLPKDVREGLLQAHKVGLKKKSRMRVRVGDQNFTILRFWDEGFSLDLDDTPNLRGLVDIYDGARMKAQCLIIASSEEDGQMVYEFKRATEAADGPALDYERDETAPVALIGRA